MDERVLTRRQLMFGAAATVGSLMLAGCSKSGGRRPQQTPSAPSQTNGATGPSAPSTVSPSTSSRVGSSATPLSKPIKLSDAPSLSGKSLPAVAERLPEKPYVLPHRWLERGKYGGTLNMVVFGSSGIVNATSIGEFFYGFSPTRWLNEGLDIGPGIADSWSSNADASEWTIHFRDGLRWSDGQLFSVDDVLFWYDDIARPQHDGQTVPVECLSAKGNPCRMSKLDQFTLRITYDAPQPLVPDYLASWVKGGIGKNGSSWVMPAHYLKQFHPKYNPKVPKDWDSPGGLWEQKAFWLVNPKCPTLIGYRCKIFDNSSQVVLERNPYYYAVTKEGDQLPYIDEVVIRLVQDAQVLKLQVQHGSVDFCQGNFNQIDLSDVSSLSKTASAGHYRVFMWDSGSGTGSMFFLNYDYVAKDKKYGELFRDRRFRQAISYAYDRTTARKTLYFQTGEPTTGTMGTKAIEFNVNDEGRSVYKLWQNAYVEHDPEKAKQLLAEIGLKDRDGDGYVEFADGSKLTVQIPYASNIAKTEAAKDDLLVENCKAVGLRLLRVPMAPTAFTPAWAAGQLMSHTNAEAAGNPNLLVYPGYFIPFNSGNNWAPLETTWNSLTGSAKQKEESNLSPLDRHPPRLAPEPDGPIAKMWSLYNQTRVVPDPMKRHQLVWKIVKIHATDGPFFMGTVANYPQVFTADLDLRNIPLREELAQHGWVNPWVYPTPAVYDPESFYWQNPDKHS